MRSHIAAYGVATAIRLVLVVAKPLPVPQYEHNPFTATFAPFKTVGCLQSFVPELNISIPHFNLVENYCLDLPYEFGSYSLHTNNTAREGDCTIFLSSERHCAGDHLSLPFKKACNIPGFLAKSLMVGCTTPPRRPSPLLPPQDSS